MIKECLPVLGESRNPWPQAGHNNCSKSPFALSVRGGAVAARWAHNPKVGGSNPPPATTLRSFESLPDYFGICDRMALEWFVELIEGVYL